MSVSRIAGRYAKSLIDLAVERNELEAIHEDILLLRSVIKQNRNFYLMLKSPIIQEDKKKKIIYSAFAGRLSDMTMKFLNIITSKKRESYIPEIIEAFIVQYNRINHITPVKLTTAVKLDESLKNRIIDIIKRKYNLDHIELHSIVDEDIVGGFILEFEGKLYDASIAHQFDELKQELFKNQYIKRI